ncbi:hypothetical protein F5B21DRAFT_500553 [Xylaria acuta]|nr:hypothetical protein F5B21DRAFT_500553 [Xylaria acuta]
MAKDVLNWIRSRIARQTPSKRSANDQQTKRTPPEVAETGKINVQASNNGSLSACKGDQEYEKLRLDYESLSEQNQQLRVEQEQLSSEKKALKNAVNMRESQILVLRPYQTRFTRDDAQIDFKILLGSISSWVEKWTDELVDDTDLSKHWMDSLKYFPQAINQLRQFLDSNPDLSSAVGYPDSDQDIISACILRFIGQRMFEGIPCSIPSYIAEALQKIEHSMPRCSAPELDRSTICSWRAQAYHALFSDRQYSEARQKGINTLSEDLAHIFGFLSNDPNATEFICSISSNIIEPSLNLYENFRRSNEEYYFETAKSIKPGTRMSQDLPDGQLRGLLGDLDCRNAVRYNAKFQVEKLKTKPTDEALRNQLHFICSIAPALKVRGLQGNHGEEAETLFKEKVLVAWDPDTLHGRDPRVLKSQTWLSRTCSI